MTLDEAFTQWMQKEEVTAAVTRCREIAAALPKEYEEFAVLVGEGCIVGTQELLQHIGDAGIAMEKLGHERANLTRPVVLLERLTETLAESWKIHGVKAAEASGEKAPAQWVVEAMFGARLLGEWAGTMHNARGRVDALEVRSWSLERAATRWEAILKWFGK